MKFVRVLSRRSLLAMFTSVALIFSGGSVFADNVKVAVFILYLWSSNGSAEFTKP